MKLYKEFSLNINNPEVISFVGGGGKTTSIRVLANELADLGLKALITTTTMIFDSIEDDGDYFFIKDISKNFQPTKGTITIFGDHIRDGKLIGSSIDKIDEIKNRNLFDYILIEADGAKRKPIKAPESYEPVICGSTTITIGVVGVDAIGLKINEDNVHRPDKLKEILSAKDGYVIDYSDVVDLALHPKGLFKSSRGKQILFVSKIKKNKDIQIGNQIRESLKDSDIKVVLGDVIDNLYY